MGNIIQIKHGRFEPGALDLESYELGYSTETQALYINDPIMGVMKLTAEAEKSIPTYNSFLENKTQIEKLGAGAIFQTLGFAQEGDGAGCLYISDYWTNDEKYNEPNTHTYAKIFPDIDRKYSPLYLTRSNSRKIEVKYYGIQTVKIFQGPGEKEHLLFDGGIAESNSFIINSLLERLNNGYSLHFETGHYFFDQPIKMSERAVSLIGSVSNLTAILYQPAPVNLGTLLHFPFAYMWDSEHEVEIETRSGKVAKMKPAINLHGGVISNIGIIGPDYHNYWIKIHRKEKPWIEFRLPVKMSEEYEQEYGNPYPRIIYHGIDTKSREETENQQDKRINVGNCIVRGEIYTAVPPFNASGKQVVLLRDKDLSAQGSECVGTIEKVYEMLDNLGATEIITCGIYIKAALCGSVQNTRVANFTYGIYSPTQNARFADCDIKNCRVGMSIGNDCKVHDIQVWNVITGIECRGPLATVSDFRGDSVGRHLVECWSGKCQFTNLDADYCLGSIIHYGKDEASKINLGSAVNVMGRCMTRYILERSQEEYQRNPESYDGGAGWENKGSKTPEYLITDIPINEYEYGAFVSISPKTDVASGYLDIYNVMASPFDGTKYGDGSGEVVENKKYCIRDTLLSIGSFQKEGDLNNYTANFNDVTIKCYLPPELSDTEISNRYFCTHGDVFSWSGNATQIITYFDSKIFERINLITPQGQLISIRNSKVNNGIRTFENISKNIENVNKALSAQTGYMQDFYNTLDDFKGSFDTSLSPSTININFHDKEMPGVGTGYAFDYYFSEKGQITSSSGNVAVYTPNYIFVKNMPWFTPSSDLQAKGLEPGKYIGVCWLPQTISGGNSIASGRMVQYDENFEIIKVGVFRGMFRYISSGYNDYELANNCYLRLEDNTAYIRFSFINWNVQSIEDFINEQGECTFKAPVYALADGLQHLSEINYPANGVYDTNMIVPYEEKTYFTVPGHKVIITDSANGDKYSLKITNGQLLLDKVEEIQG